MACIILSERHCTSLVSVKLLEFLIIAVIVNYFWPSFGFQLLSNTFLAILLFLLGFFYAIFCFIDFSSDIFSSYWVMSMGSQIRLGCWS